MDCLLPKAGKYHGSLVDNGGKKMPVVLTKEGSEYVGPNGEHYAAIPSTEQLQGVYGKTVAPAANSNSITLWLDNNGTKMPVTLQKQGTNYVGPNGEQYTTLPTADQLKPIYARLTAMSSAFRSPRMTVHQRL